MTTAATRDTFTVLVPTPEQVQGFARSLAVWHPWGDGRPVGDWTAAASHCCLGGQPARRRVQSATKTREQNAATTFRPPDSLKKPKLLSAPVGATAAQLKTAVGRAPCCQRARTAQPVLEIIKAAPAFWQFLLRRVASPGGLSADASGRDLRPGGRATAVARPARAPQGGGFNEPHSPSGAPPSCRAAGLGPRVDRARVRSCPFRVHGMAAAPG